MKQRLTRLVMVLHPVRLSALTSYLLKDEAISGKIILGATILALIAANTAFQVPYDIFWHTDLSIGLDGWALSKDLRHWVNEALMAIFFLVVGLELKRELVIGELRKPKTALLPFAAAIGGMAIPALVYVLCNQGSSALNGWAIPMATDIAFAVGVLSFVGKRVPSSLRLFLLTLAIVDDIGAVIIIALFYSGHLNFVMLFATALLTGVVMLLHKRQLLSMPVFIFCGILIWLSIDGAGIHASIAGALIGLLAPLTTHGTKKSVASRLEKHMIPLSTLFVIPLFAFANTGITITFSSLSGDNHLALASGVVAGLVIGKVVGISGVSWVMIKLRLAHLPTGTTWRHIIGIGFMAGIGFTVSIFVTELAFGSNSLVTPAKLSVFIASALSGLLGTLVLRWATKQPSR